VRVTAMVRPSAAERAMTVLARATSAEVRWPGQGEQTVTARHLRVVDGPGRANGRPATVELAEAAPLPVRDRVLTRVRMSGQAWPDPGDATVLRLAPSAITVEEAGVVAAVRVADLLAAEPDPFACCEAAVLSHLDAAHPDLVATLTSLVDSRHLQGVVRVWPLRLDQHGIVLRLEHAQRHRDVRLGFASPTRTTEDARTHLRALAAEATWAPS
jgi:hypothetical protein